MIFSLRRTRSRAVATRTGYYLESSKNEPGGPRLGRRTAGVCTGLVLGLRVKPPAFRQEFPITPLIKATRAHAHHLVRTRGVPDRDDGAAGDPRPVPVARLGRLWADRRAGGRRDREP